LANLVTALGLAFILEGLPYFLFAEENAKACASLSDVPRSNCAAWD
jgi:uncharacterized protein YjeT (DUF2065 family)